MSWQVRRFEQHRDWAEREQPSVVWRLEHVADGKDDLPTLDVTAILDLGTALGESVNVTINIAAPPPPPISTATTAELSITGGPGMQITVDTNPGSESVSLDYHDDKLDLTAPAADASGVGFAVDDSSILALGDVVSTPTGYTAPITPGTIGTATISVTGNLGSKSDGSAIAAPAPIQVPVVAGPADNVVLGEVDTPVAVIDAPAAAPDAAAGA